MVRDARARRDWTLTELARRTGVSVATVHHVEAGRAASLETYARLAAALGPRLEATPVDPRRPSTDSRGDPVHAAIGEIEAATLRARGFRVAIDEPYQHFQFAGRADVVAWDESRRALLHIENRTRFPNLQEAAGAFNAKRAYLGGALAERPRLPQWRSEAHVMVVAWTTEAIRDMRRLEASLRSTARTQPSASGRGGAARHPRPDGAPRSSSSTPRRRPRSAGGDAGSTSSAPLRPRPAIEAMRRSPTPSTGRPVRRGSAPRGTPGSGPGRRCRR